MPQHPKQVKLLLHESWWLLVVALFAYLALVLATCAIAAPPDDVAAKAKAHLDAGEFGPAAAAARADAWRLRLFLALRLVAVLLMVLARCAPRPRSTPASASSRRACSTCPSTPLARPNIC